MRVVGIDPGKHIGMCLYQEGEYRAGLEAHGMRELSQTLRGWAPDLVVAEDFRGGYAHTNHRDPLMALGAVALICEDDGLDLVLQSPAILRTRLPLAEGLHPSRHVRCAAAHVIHFLRKQAM